MSDFELVAMNVFAEIFPNARVKGRLFHWAQAVWRNVVDRGLRQQFDQDEEIRKCVQQLIALPFVPTADVIDVFDQLSADAPEGRAIDSLFDYVERTFIRGRRGPARYGVEVWNVYELVVEKLQRTNNVVEG